MVHNDTSVNMEDKPLYIPAGVSAKRKKIQTSLQIWMSTEVQNFGWVQ